MIPWVLLDTAPIPGGADLRLLQRGQEYSIRLGQAELMNSRLSGSEEALATLSIERLGAVDAPRLLIGGLGMGFTLRAALAHLGPRARVDVAELVPAVVRWARGPMQALFAGSVDDPRVTIEEGDVGALMQARPKTYDAILLDVDNGPEGMTRDSNDSLYGSAGLGIARRALRRGGVLAVWSQGPDAAFAKRFQKAGFSVEDVRVRAHRGKSGARHVIWLGRMVA